MYVLCSSLFCVLPETNLPDFLLDNKVQVEAESWSKECCWNQMSISVLFFLIFLLFLFLMKHELYISRNVSSAERLPEEASPPSPVWHSTLQITSHLRFTDAHHILKTSSCHTRRRWIVKQRQRWLGENPEEVCVVEIRRWCCELNWKKTLEKKVRYRYCWANVLGNLVFSMCVALQNASASIFYHQTLLSNSNIREWQDVGRLGNVIFKI